MGSLPERLSRAKPGSASSVREHFGDVLASDNRRANSGDSTLAHARLSSTEWLVMCEQRHGRAKKAIVIQPDHKEAK
jgi:hypothetical protein